MRKTILLLIFGALLLTPKTGSAFFDEFVDRIDININSTNRFFPDSGIASDPNDIGVFESRLDVEYDINPDRDITWELDFITKQVFIDGNSNLIDLPSTLVGRAMRLGIKYPVPLLDDSDYRLGTAVVPSYYTDSWGDSFGDFETGAFRWVYEVWAEYNGDNPFAWKLGVIVLPEQTDVILPIIEMTYAFNDQWAFRLRSDDLGFVYTIDDRWELFTEFRYVLDEYEISSNGIDGRVLRQKQNTVGLGVQYNFDENKYVKAVGGYGFNRVFRFQDNISETEVDIDNAPYFGLEIAWQF